MALVGKPDVLGQTIKELGNTLKLLGQQLWRDPS